MDKKNERGKRSAEERGQKHGNLSNKLRPAQRDVYPVQNRKKTQARSGWNGLDGRESSGLFVSRSFLQQQGSVSVLWSH